jgi:hypothetical protein
MADRAKFNPRDQEAVYGPLDEIVVKGCDLHLEQMGVGIFIMSVSRGDELMRVKIFAPGRGRVHVDYEVDEGFTDLDLMREGAHG